MKWFKVLELAGGLMLCYGGVKLCLGLFFQVVQEYDIDTNMNLVWYGLLWFVGGILPYFLGRLLPWFFKNT